MINYVKEWVDLSSDWHSYTISLPNGNDDLEEDWQKEIDALWCFSADVFNGGVIQFFGNWGLITSRYAVFGLQKIGAKNKSDLLIKSGRIIHSLDLPELSYTLIRSRIDDITYNVLLNISYEIINDKDDICELGYRYYVGES